MADTGYPPVDNKSPNQWNQPPPYNPSSVYPPPSGFGPTSYDGSVGVVNTQPQHTATNVVITNPPQQQPNHGLAVASLVFAIVTLIISCGGSFICGIPSIILSILALATDNRADQAKTFSIASLVLTGVYWICVVIAVVVVVIWAVTAANSVDYGYNPYNY